MLTLWSYVFLALAHRYDMILHTAVQWLKQNINQSLNSQKTPHILPSGVSYGLSVVKILQKFNCVIVAPNCTVLNADILHSSPVRAVMGCVLRYQGLTCVIFYLLTRQAMNTGWWEVDIHGCYSLVKITLGQFAHARTIGVYDVTMPVTSVRVTSQINCSDVTMLNQKRPSLATTAKSAIDICFQRNCAFRDTK